MTKNFTALFRILKQFVEANEFSEILGVFLSLQRRNTCCFPMISRKKIATEKISSRFNLQLLTFSHNNNRRPSLKNLYEAKSSRYLNLKLDMTFLKNVVLWMSNSIIQKAGGFSFSRQILESTS